MKKLIIAVAGLSLLAGAAAAQGPAKDTVKQEDKNAPMAKDRDAMPKAMTKGMQKGSDMPKAEMQGEPKKK